MSTGVDWLLHLITVLVGTVSQMSTGVDYVDEQRNSQKGSVDTVSGMSTGVDSFFHTHNQKRWVVSKMSTEVDFTESMIFICWNCKENVYWGRRVDHG